MASVRKSRFSTLKVTKKLSNGRKVTRYLSARDEEKGLDIFYDLKGYDVTAL